MRGDLWRTLPEAFLLAARDDSYLYAAVHAVNAGGDPLEVLAHVAVTQAKELAEYRKLARDRLMLEGPKPFIWVEKP